MIVLILSITMREMSVSFFLSFSLSGRWSGGGRCKLISSRCHGSSFCSYAFLSLFSRNWGFLSSVFLMSLPPFFLRFPFFFLTTVVCVMVEVVDDE